MASPQREKLRLIGGFAIAVTIVIVIVVLSYRNTVASLRASQWVAHTHEVISTLEEVLAGVHAAETSQRAYVITGDASYAAESRAVRLSIAAALRHLGTLLRDNRQEQARLAGLSDAVGRKLKRIDEVIAVRQREGFDAARALILDGAGQAMMRDVVGRVSDMRRLELQLLEQRRTRSERQARRVLVALSVAALVDAALVAALLLLVIRDRRRNDRLQHALASARDSALHAAELRAQFLANMSHEIRTPMNAVVGMTGLLLDTRLNDEQRELAETVRDSANALLGIINDILDFSKIEAGKVEIEISDFDLRAIVESVIDLFSEAAAAKKLEIGVLFDHDLPPLVRGDAGRLRQVLTNLVGNAVKFTTRGEVILHLNRQAAGDADHVPVRFAVTDTGIGMTDEVIDGLFRPFSQADASTTRKYGGTGLGLAISKELVELMGGVIDVQSAPGKGSTFWFTLPLQRASREALPVRPAAATLHGLRVLVVDDNETNRRVIRHNLAAWKMAADEAAGGDEALAVLRRAAESGSPHQLAIIDMVMPGIDGTTLARLIKADPAIASTRLIVLTSLTGKLDAALMRAAGVDASLTKPVKQSALFDAIATAMSAGETTPPKREGPAATHARRHHVRVLVAEDNPVNQKLALRQLEKLGVAADAVGDGIEALEALGRIGYNLVFMDCQMPEMDGYAATREIRRREGSARHTPVLALTAHALEGDRERCLAAGMDDYLSKPVRESDIAQALDRWLPAGKDDPLDEEAIRTLRDLGNGSDTFLREVAVLYFEDAPPRMEAIAAAIRNEDAEELASAAHALKSSSGNIGATGVREAAEELEHIGRNGSVEGAEASFTRLQGEYRRAADRLRELAGLE